MGGEKVTIIDAENAILGRLASVIAKRLLMGERIIVVNAEKAVISGDRHWIMEHYLEKVQRGDRYKGPFFPRRPDLVLKRTVRGMIPWKNWRGRKAMRRLTVYIGVPKELEGKEFEVIEEAKVDRLGSPRFVTLAEVCERIGWRA